MKVLHLSQIWIYPIKSLGGISLSEARVLPKGLEYDRRWMLIDENGVFMTQRAYPTMALFRTSLVEGGVAVRFERDKITIPFVGQETEPIVTRVWDDAITVRPLGGPFSDWFSEKLGVSCRLVRFPEENSRTVQHEAGVRQERISLADAYPFLVIGQASLDDLNGRLSKPVPMNRFRPNFVIDGGKPYEEDSWLDFAIGTNRFKGVKRCSRCTMTTVDQDKGTKGSEPLKTLSTYRTRNNKTYFGINLVARDHLQVRLGDPVQVNALATENID